MTSFIGKVFLDVLEFNKSNAGVLLKELAELGSLEGINISDYELDEKEENIKIAVEGKFSDADMICEII